MTADGARHGAIRQGAIRQTNEALILAAAERVFARASFNGATVAAIADEAGLPKANLHYYFGSKQALYQAVLARTLHDWLAPLDGLVPDADPADALAPYIRSKMLMSAQRPDASRVFANELLHGAAVVGTLMRGELRDTVRRKAAVIDGWIAAGRMAPVDSTPPFFSRSGPPSKPTLILRCRCGRCWAGMSWPGRPPARHRA